MNQNIPVPTTKDAAFEAVVACGKLTSALSVAAEITGSAAIDSLCDIALEMTDRLARLCAALESDAQPSYIACAGSMPCDEITGSAAIDSLCDIALEMTDRLARLCAALESDAQPSYIACAGSMPCDLDDGRLRAVCRKLVDDCGDEVRAIVRKVDGLVETAPRPERCAVSVRTDVSYAMR